MDAWHALPDFGPHTMRLVTALLSNFEEQVSRQPLMPIILLGSCSNADEGVGKHGACLTSESAMNPVRQVQGVQQQGSRMPQRPQGRQNPQPAAWQGRADSDLAGCWSCPW